GAADRGAGDDRRAQATREPARRRRRAVAHGAHRRSHDRQGADAGRLDARAGGQGTRRGDADTGAAPAGTHATSARTRASGAIDATTASGYADAHAPIAARAVIASAPVFASRS